MPLGIVGFPDRSAYIPLNIVGRPDRSEYAPEVATVAKLGTPVRSPYSPLNGVPPVGIPVKSWYLPEVATSAKLGRPAKSAYAPLNIIGRPERSPYAPLNIDGLPDKSPYAPEVATVARPGTSGVQTVVSVYGRVGGRRKAIVPVQDAAYDNHVHENVPGPPHIGPAIPQRDLPEISNCSADCRV